MLKGFIIFFTATAWPVSWSLAELSRHQIPHIPISCTNNLPHKPKGTHAHRLQVRVPLPRSVCDILLQRTFHSYRLVISNVVPKICARTNSAILPVLRARSNARFCYL